MADYDASVRICTKIDTEKATAQLLSLENRMLKAGDKVSELNRRMKELEGRKTPTEEYAQLQTQLAKSGEELKRLIDRQNELESIGIRSGSAWNSINNEVADTAIHVDDIKEKMYQLESAGKAFTIGSDTEEYSRISRQLTYAENSLKVLELQHENAIGKMEGSEQSFGQKSASIFRKIAAAAGSAFSKAASVANKVLTKTSDIFHKIGNTAKRVFQKLHSDTGKQNSLLSTMKSRLGGIALSLLVFNWISKGFNAMITGMKEGLRNLAKYSREYNGVMSEMVSALATLKNAFATAFAPIASVVIPYLTQLINWLTTAVNKVAQFISALTGKTTWTKAKKQTIDYAGSLDKVSDSAKKAYNSLASFDELNVLNKREDTDAGAGGINPSDMFEEMPIDSGIKKLADKIKAILGKLFVPLKRAWDRQGRKVMDAWKYALKEVSALAKSIGEDFLEVWTQEATVHIFEDVLLILADIGLVVGNLARQFREAWEENETGKKILENVRDLFGIIVENIREAADLTVDWAGKLNFTPLLEAFERFTRSLAPLIDFLSGVLSDFYTQVLLPLAKWTIEKGLPEFLDIMTNLNQGVDWEGLRKRLSEFWTHLEPFAEKVGEGLIIFIGRLTDKLADFLGSETFENFLSRLEEWMDNADPEDIADGLKKIAWALAGFEILKTVGPIFASVLKFLRFFGKEGEASAAAAGISGIGNALEYLVPILGGLGGFELIKNPLIDWLADINGEAEKAEILKERYDGISGTLLGLKDVASITGQKLAGLFTNMPTYVDGLTPSWQVLEEAVTKVGDGAIYTDEQLQKMQNTMGLTEDDIETVRQAMLDANPELLNLADNFGLFDSSVQTLKNVSDGMQLMKDGIFESRDALEQYAEKNNYTSEAVEFLSERLNDLGGQSIKDFKEGLESSGQSIKDFENGLGQVEQRIEDLEEDFSAAGTNMTDGFLNGFNYGAESIGDAAGNLCESLLATVRDKWGIHSPSTVMAEIGEFLITGLIKGISDAKSYLLDALNNIYDTVTGIMEKIMSFVSGIVESVTSKVSSIKNSISNAIGLKGSAGKNTRAAVAYSGYQMPELATGGVTTGMTIAKIGEAGREAVLPLENNTGWMDTLAQKINSSGTITVVAELDGDVVFRKTVEKNDIFRKQNGHSAYAY